ncbi:hypothetical protein [Microbacterium sp. NPDC096154]|uniref:hypothetical protein n=1 Tax=Microbacterium sp. NPDC096154 TaxID=3155549 RepID=UPI00331E4D6B
MVAEKMAPASRASATFERGLVALLVALLPIRALSPVFDSIVSVGVLLATPFLFVPVSRIVKTRTAVAIIGGYLAIFATSPLLWLLTGGRDVDWQQAGYAMLTMVVSLIHLVVLLWARGSLELSTIASLYALGLSLQTLLTLDTTAGNPWKFGLALPMSVLALTLSRRASVVWPTVALTSAMAVSILNDYRSFTAIALAALIIWLANRAVAGRPWLKLFATAALTVMLYVLGTQAALAGWLGERNQRVSQMQVANAGSLIAGGRVESAATIALFWEKPLGMGPGVLPTAADIAVGKTALMGRGVNIDGDLVNDYLFGYGIKLHSVAADLWINYGLAGLALALVILGILFQGLVAAFRDQATPAFVFLLVIAALWDMAFSPIGTNLWTVIFTAALVTKIPAVSSSGDSLRAGKYINA